MESGVSSLAGEDVEFKKFEMRVEKVCWKSGDRLKVLSW